MTVADVTVQHSDTLSHLVDQQSQLCRAYGNTFTSELGQMVLDDIRIFCGVGKDAYVQSMFDQTAYNLGMQRVWLHIHSRINAVPITEALHTTEENLDE